MIDLENIPCLRKHFELAAAESGADPEVSQAQDTTALARVSTYPAKELILQNGSYVVADQKEATT